jgi:DNA-binding NarL/FixJ family response regulator
MFSVKSNDNSKDKKVKKTLLRAGDKINDSDMKMRIVKLGYEKYYIQSKDDMIYLVHKLAYKGFTVSEIAVVLGISEKTVKKYLEDCW